jgi:8-oxo-dGTP diphosphatase
MEELGLQASFHPGIGARLPFFLTVTPTLPTPGGQSHVDISMWFVLACDRAAELRPDPGEFRSVEWLGIDERTQWPTDRFDPQMSRFIGKLKVALSS